MDALDMRAPPFHVAEISVVVLSTTRATPPVC